MYYIKNKFIRGVVSFLIVMTLYFAGALSISNQSNSNVFQTMLVLFIFYFFIVPPILFFSGYFIYTKLTPIADRTTKSINKIVFSTLSVVIAILLFLYAAAMFVNLV